MLDQKKESMWIVIYILSLKTDPPPPPPSMFQILRSGEPKWWHSKLLKLECHNYPGTPKINSLAYFLLLWSRFCSQYPPLPTGRAVGVLILAHCFGCTVSHLGVLTCLPWLLMPLLTNTNIGIDIINQTSPTLLSFLCNKVLITWLLLTCTFLSWGDPVLISDRTLKYKNYHSHKDGVYSNIQQCFSLLRLQTWGLKYWTWHSSSSLIK